MPESNLTLLPEAPNQTYVAVAAAFVRGILQIMSGLGFAWSLAVTGDQVMMIATSVVMLGTLVWSAWQKIEAIRKNNQSSIQSAVQSAQATAEAGGIPTAIAVVSSKGKVP